MAVDADDFRALMAGVLAGRADAVDRLCRTYQAHILRVVRRRLLRRLRTRFDSLDFVHDVWASFFAKPPRDQVFDTPEALIGYLERMAQHKVGAAVRKGYGTRKYAVARERRFRELNGASADEALHDHSPTPSQLVMAEEEWERLLRAVHKPAHRGMLRLLRQGHTYREIAARLNTTEKTVQRLVRRLFREANP